MLGNSRRSPHRYNQVWWKLKAIRNRAGFISISNNTQRNGERADGKWNPLGSLQALMACLCAAQACDSQAARSPETRSPGGM